jgi:hypothetical protein
MMRYLLHKSHISLLTIVCCLYILIIFLSEYWILTDQFFYENLSVQFSFYAIDDILESRERFWWTVYVVQVIVVICKTLFATLCIFIGVILSDIDFSFKDLFRFVIISEFIFVIAQAIYLINLYVNRAELTFDTMANYFPISMLSFYGVENVVPWLHYPLQTLNLFEVFYILLISWLLSKQWKPDFVESINIVLPSYGIGLLLWMVLVVFLTLQIS